MEQSAKENSCGELSYEEDDGRVVDAKVEQLSAVNEDSYVVTRTAIASCTTRTSMRKSMPTLKATGARYMSSPPP